MRWTRVCPLLGVALFACATEENDFPSPSSLTSGADNAGGSAGFGGSGGAEVGGSSVGGGTSGSFGTSGTSASGTSARGTFGASGSTSF
ncbi:MAG TPA: lysophospholipase, partial [Polyangiaceae bacterium]|nr:lysophospholipase [Polyangiaceae bacterium]